MKFFFYTSSEKGFPPKNNSPLFPSQGQTDVGREIRCWLQDCCPEEGKKDASPPLLQGFLHFEGERLTQEQYPSAFEPSYGWGGGDLRIGDTVTQAPPPPCYSSPLIRVAEIKPLGQCLLLIRRRPHFYVTFASTTMYEVCMQQAPLASFARLKKKKKCTQRRHYKSHAFSSAFSLLPASKVCCSVPTPPPSLPLPPPRSPTHLLPSRSLRRPHCYRQTNTCLPGNS